MKTWGMLSMLWAVWAVGCTSTVSDPNEPTEAPDAGHAGSPEAGPEMAPDASDAGTEAEAAPAANDGGVSCYAPVGSTYCGDAGTDWWCSSAPGQMAPPTAGCAVLPGSFWDGGIVTAQGWCCP